MAYELLSYYIILYKLTELQKIFSNLLENEFSLDLPIKSTKFEFHKSTKFDIMSKKN